MQYEWDDEKRKANLKSHGLDFVDAPKVFSGPTFAFEDDRLPTKNSGLSLSAC